MSTISPPTWQDAVTEIWRLFEETNARFKETAERFRETDQRFKETDARLDQRIKETDAQFKETDARLDQRIKETDARLDQRIKQTDARLDKRFAQTDRKINRLAGTFGQQWGKLVEALIKLDVVRLFQERGIEVKFVSPRVKRSLGGETMELDLLLLNSDELVVIESKSALKTGDVRDFLADLADFKRFFPEYAGYRLYGAVAGLEIERSASKFAYRKGLFVLAITGQNLVEIRNNKAFKPKDFGTTK
jgi:hypothetical protein